MASGPFKPLNSQDNRSTHSLHMQTSADLPLDRPLAPPPERAEAVVQDRPTLGSLPRTSRGVSWWLVPGIDLLASSTALLAIAVFNGDTVFPALPLAPLLLVLVYGLLGVYTAKPSQGGFEFENGMAWPIIRLVVAALFAWSASLLTPLTGGAQLALFALFVILDIVGRMASAPILRRMDRVERWVLVGDDATAERLRTFAPLRDYAQVVCTVSPGEDPDDQGGRVSALEVVDRYQADRVVIATRHADDKGLLDLVRSFKSIGVPVSLLPRPLDLLEAPAARPNNVGGVPLIDVEALAARPSVPYVGPGPPGRSKDQDQRRGPRHERGGEHRPRAERAPRRSLRGDPRRRQLPGQHDRGGRAGLSRHPGADPERPRQGRCLPHRLRRRQGQPGRDARRRRLRRPGRDSPFRRGPRSGSGLRQGVPLPSRRRQRRHHADPQARQRGPQRNGESPARNPLHGPLLRLQRLLGPLPAVHRHRRARLRGRDPDQPPHRRRRG